MSPAPLEKTLPFGSDFSSKAVLCLIEAVGRRWGLYETRERSQLFQSVQEEMASKGHMLPVEKIRRKWNNLIVTYKRVKDRSRMTGHAKTSWEFFDVSVLVGKFMKRPFNIIFFKWWRFFLSKLTVSKA